MPVRWYKRYNFEPLPKKLMIEHDTDRITHAEFTSVAEDVFDALATQFPVCMESDEFHFFPQAKAKDFDWSRWDDFTPEAIESVTGQLKCWSRQIGRYPPASLPFAQAMDAKMLKRAVQTLVEQLALVKLHEIQPTFYLTIAGIGLAEAFAAGPQAMNSRLRSLPGFLDQARHNLKRIPRLFRDLGVDMLDKQRGWLDSLSLPDHLHAPIDAALRRLEDHLHRSPVVEDFLLPVSLYERIASHHMGCLLTPDEIAQTLDREIVETRSILERSAASLAPGRRWQQAVGDLVRPPIPAGGMADVYRGTIHELARHCLENGLISSDLLRDCPVTVAPIPAYMRPVRSNAAYSMPPVYPPRGGTFFLLETNAQASISADFRLLTAHETYPGHHLLDTCRWAHERPIRRHLEFPIFYEGWASFAEELMFDTGFFSTPVDHMLMAKRRFWRAMRGKVDFDIHMHRCTIDEATERLVSEGMAPRRARAMVRRYCLKPGYQLAYTIGRRRFRQYYDAFCRQGADPAGFARRVLAQGEISFDHLEQVLIRGGGH
jgi:hypothetical protein